MKAGLREAVAAGAEGVQDRVLVAMRSHRMRKLARVWCERQSVVEGDALWACMAWLQLDESIGLDVYRPSRGPGSRAVAFWQTVALFRGHWDYRCLGEFEESDIEVLERAGRVHTALRSLCRTADGDVVDVDARALRGAFQSLKNNSCYRGAGGRALFDQYVGVLLCAGYIVGDIGLDDDDTEWWSGVRELRYRLREVLPGLVSDVDGASDISVSIGEDRVLRVGLALFAGQQSDGPAVEEALDVYYPCDIDTWSGPGGGTTLNYMQAQQWMTSHTFDAQNSFCRH